MEILLLVVFLVILLINIKKTKELRNQIDFLSHKIDGLGALLVKKTIQPLVAEGKETKIEKTREKPKEIRIDKEKEIKESVKTHADKVKEIIEEKPKKAVEEPLASTPENQPVKVLAVRQKTNRRTLQDRFESFKKRNPDLETFIGENLISKIGILILVLGISFFVKYAIDQEWINEVGRVGIGFLSGAILLGFAHRLQKNYKAFSSILVSGAIVVFYFVVTYAFKEYQLYSQTVAFVLMIIVTIFSTVISILYNRKELAVLSLIGGFAAPVLASTGSGNYIVLFTYLLIVNIGFLVVSIKKKWLIINILAFVFTHIMFVSWLASDTHIQENSGRLFVFASLFYLVFFVMNLYKIILEKKQKIKPLVMSLFLLSTFVYFGQGLYTLNYFAPSFKGLFTLLLALINLSTGWRLLKNNHIDKKTVYLFIGMTLTFLTLAGPIQLEGNYITLFWAAESVLLIWLSQKIKHNGFRLAAFITFLLALGSLWMDFIQIYTANEELAIIFNKGFVTGIFTVVSLGLSAYLFKKEKNLLVIRNFKLNPLRIATLLSIIAGVVLYVTGLLELSHQSYKHFDHYLATTLVNIYQFVFIILLILYLFRSKKLQKAGIIVSVLAILYSIGFFVSLPFNAFRSSVLRNALNPTFYIQFILLLLVLFIMYLVYKQVNREEYGTKSKKYLSYFLASVFVILMSLEVLIISQPILIGPKITSEANQSLNIFKLIDQSLTTVIKTSFPILWGILSFVFLYFGIKKEKKEWRIFSLVLIAITIVKLFTYDIGTVSQGGKIIAFIILGVVLLIISFMYQKIKKALFKDKKNEE